MACVSPGFSANLKRPGVTLAMHRSGGETPFGIRILHPTDQSSRRPNLRKFRTEPEMPQAPTLAQFNSHNEDWRWLQSQVVVPSCWPESGWGRKATRSRRYEVLSIPFGPL